MSEPDPSRPQRLRAAAVRVDHARVVATGRAIPVLEKAVKLVRIPTFLVLLAPVVPAIALAVIGVFADGSARWTLLVIALAVLGIGLLFGRRRRALLSAVDDREELTQEFVRAFSAGDAWGRIQPQLTGMASDIGSPKQGFAMIRGWRNLLAIAVGAASSLDDYPRVAPFTPGALRTTWLLGVVCLVTGAISTILAVICLFLLLAGVI